MFIEDLCVRGRRPWLCSRAIYFVEFERINSVLYYGAERGLTHPPAQLLWPLHSRSRAVAEINSV